MRASRTANAIVLGLASAAFAFAACAGGSTPPGAPATPEGTAGPTTTVAAAPPTAAQPEAPKPKPTPRTAADCKELVSDITNDPPAGGVPLNNAMTAKDAGASDRLEAITEIVKARRDGFRCCFDIYAKDHPGAAGAMKMQLELAKDGALKNATFVDTPNRVSAPEVEACMVSLARSLTYPKSPSGKETRFTYPFDFKARR